MKTTYTRFIGVAIVVCLFAVGMATLLNYYKFKSTIEKVVRDRVLITANTIDASVESSLGLGMGFSELSMLPSLMERERAADRLVTAIEVFDPAGKILYSTTADRVGGSVPGHWLAAASRAKDEWTADAPREYVAGIVVRNNFNLAVGYIAMSYDREYVARSVREVGRNLAAIGAIAFLLVAATVSGALILILRRFGRDMHAIEAHVTGQGAPEIPGAFAPAVGELKRAISSAESELARVRTRLAEAGD
jgi:hypothetical protein